MTPFATRARELAAQRLRDLAETATATHAVLPAVATAAELMRDVLSRGGRLFFCGNGGSAADAQHVATEYVVRYRKERRALAAIALTTDTSLLTAAGNDLGFEAVFARQVDALVTAADALVIHSTSGNSPNVLQAARRARAKGARVIGLTAGSGGALLAEQLCDVCIVVPTDRTDRAQELHLCIQHAICELIEDEA
jgi:D-sedoheptulose 7-phosphate isomerase